VLDELGLDRQAALELKLKAALHQKILQLVKRRGYRARDLERIPLIQQPRVSELTRGKLSTLSVHGCCFMPICWGLRQKLRSRKPEPTRPRKSYPSLFFHNHIVTSDLAQETEPAHHGQGGGGTSR